MEVQDQTGEKAFRSPQKLKQSTPKDPERREQRQQAIQTAYQADLEVCVHYLDRMEAILAS